MFILPPIQNNLNDDQQQAIRDIRKWYFKSDSQFIILSGAGGCVDADTEFLTPTGWKKIADYNGEQIAQWYPHDNHTDFVTPLDHVVYPAKTLKCFNAGNLKMVLSDEHRVPTKTRTNSVVTKSALAVAQSGRAKFPRAFTHPTNAMGIPLPDKYIKVLIMQSADGTVLPVKSAYKISINLKRQDKQKRCVELLNNANIPFTVTKGALGYKRFNYYPPAEICTKDLCQLWEVNTKQLSTVYQELLFWDGSHTKRKNVVTPRFTGNKRNADLAQYVFSTMRGKYATITKDTRSLDVYNVYGSNAQNTVFDLKRETTHSVKEIPTVDGCKYCFTTPTSYWLARKDGKIFPTGNTGKTHILANILHSLQERYKFCMDLKPNNSKYGLHAYQRNLNFVVTATQNDPVSGLRAKGFSDAVTIYSTLSLRVRQNYSTGETYLAKSEYFQDCIDTLEKFTSLIVIDEASYLDKEVFDILSSIKARFLLIGDSAQLKSVSNDDFSVFDPSLKIPTITLNTNERAGCPDIKLMSQELREAVQSSTYVPIRPNGTTIHVLEDKDFLAALKHRVIEQKHDPDSLKVLTFHNSVSIDYNSYVRNCLGKPTTPEKGDMLVANNHYCNSNISALILKPSQRIKVNAAKTFSACHERIINDFEFPQHLSTLTLSKTTVLNTKPVTDTAVVFKSPQDRLDTLAKAQALGVSGRGWSAHFNAKNKVLDYRFIHSETIHKSQGRTYDYVFIDLPDIFENHQLDTILRLVYVAFSRTRISVYIRKLPQKTLEKFYV